MSALNPFFENEVPEFKSETQTVMEKEPVNSTSCNTSSNNNGILLDDIAEELIKNKFVLTALELYTEIQERGKDLQRLKNYFSNPSNFDLVVNRDGATGGLCKYGRFCVA